MIYVATVCKLWEPSGRDDGSWASFINKQKSHAIKSAIAARRKWEEKGYGPYRIIVGTLREEVAIPVAYTLKPVESEDEVSQ